MSLEVFRYLSDSGGNFTENLPTSQRPPVPGEENDTLSNDGKGSQCSKSGESSSGGTVRNEKSPAATPRRSNLYPVMLDPLKKLAMTDDDAPLGFEPEGSASVTPPYTRWTESLHALLADDDGIRLFKQFLHQEKAEDPLLFWLATEGFKKKSSDDPKRTELAKVIYRRFVKIGGQQAVKISPANRTLTEESVRKNSFDHTLFDLAQAEVEESIRETTYPLFLKSDLYVQYINTGGVSPKSSGGSSCSGNSRLPGFLPTLPEDAELTDIPREELTDLHNKKPVPLTSEMLMATSCYRSGYSREQQEGHYLKGSTSRLMNPYHTSYAAFAPAASANDSELQSLSSDAISDDTMSLTNSSVDGISISRHSKQSQRRRQHRAMKTSIRQNGKVASFPPFPHMQRPQKEVQQMAPLDFARILTEKLERVVQERDAQERLVARLKEVEESECEADVSSSSVATENAPALTSFNSNGNMVEVDDPNSILDEHCSRVFMDSARHSPGNFSPGSKSPERARRAKSASSIPGMPQMPTGYTKQMLHKQKSRSKDALPRDSGLPQDYIDTDIAPHLPKYHHHYYSQKSKHQIEIDATCRTMAAYVQERSEPSYNKYCAHSDTGVSSYPYDMYVDTGKYKKGKSTSSKKSDTSSISKTTDSGIYEGPPSLPSDGEKTNSIEQWIRHGEHYNYKKAPSRGREQQHKRSAHRLPGEMQMSSSMSPHRPQHLASKRTTVSTLAYNTSRPSSVERPYTPTNPLHTHSKRSVPSQPIMQDPCMPLNPPPDSMTLLEEVRRRIESSSKQQKLRHQEASRSKERKPSSSNSNHQGTVRVTSAPVKMSVVSPEEQLLVSGSSNAGKTTASLSKNRHSAPVGPEQKTTVTVAYYFCNDPIPYRTTLPGEQVTLAQFKTLITKKGNYRYTFKTPSDEFDTGVVHEIISDEDAVLPIFHGKIIGKVEKID